MSAKSTEALTSSILNRWSETHNPAAATTAIAAHAAVANYRHTLDVLRELPADSVHCVVTSPP